MAAASFLHDAEGRTLIRPWGRRGPTYLVPPEREAAITRFTALWYTAMLAVIVAATVTVGWPWAFAAGLPLFAIYLAGLHRFTRDLPRANATPVETTRDLQVVLARESGPVWRWLTFATSLLFVAAGVWMVFRGERTGWLVVAFFALCAANPLWQAWLLRRADAARQRPPQG